MKKIKPIEFIDRPRINCCGITDSGRTAWIVIEHKGIIFGGKVSVSLLKNLIQINKSK